MAQWVRALDPQAEGWVLESKPRKTQVVKTGSDGFTAKPSAIGVSVTGSRGDHYKLMPNVTVGVAR